jgi:hypothetical protein
MAPFRGGGPPCNYSYAIGTPTHPRGAGSLLVRTMSLAVHLPGFVASDRLLRMTDAAMANCTHPALV